MFIEGCSVEFALSIDMAQVHEVDFAAEFSAFDDCTAVDKQKIFFDLYAIALIDESYPDAKKITPPTAGGDYFFEAFSATPGATFVKLRAA